MRTLSLVFAPLALLLPHAVRGHSSLRASRTTGTRTTVVKACSCDCCLVEQEKEDHTVHHQSSDSLQCMPKSGAFAARGAAEDGDAVCADVCMLPESMRSAFQSEKGEADYSRYCMAQCRPASTKLHELCVDVNIIEQSADASAAAAKPTAGAVDKAPRKDQAMAQVGAAVTSGATATSESALVLLAKQKMMEVELEAEAAGRAAFTARTAYERMKRTADEMAQLAGESTLKEIKAEAAQQSKKAMDIRLAYEQNARNTAIKNAINAANVYSKAQTRDMALADTWQLRAGEYATAANQREEMAMDFSAEAEKYRSRNQMDLAKQKIVMAHQAIDQAAAFGAQSESAHKQAQAIANSKGWYEYAKRAIASHILAKSMPHDVAPPPMPAIA